MIFYREICIKHRVLLVAVLFLFCLAFCRQIQADDSHDPTTSHMLLQISYFKNTFKIEKVHIVDHALPKRRDTRHFYPWQATVIDKNSTVLYKAGLDDPTVLRGEFVNFDDFEKIDSHPAIKKNTGHFTIRVPFLAGGNRITFSKLKSRKRPTAGRDQNDLENLGSVEYPQLLEAQRRNQTY